jgi:hypothetical protein
VLVMHGIKPQVSANARRRLWAPQMLFSGTGSAVAGPSGTRSNRTVYPADGIAASPTRIEEEEVSLAAIKSTATGCFVRPGINSTQPSGASSPTGLRMGLHSLEARENVPNPCCSPPGYKRRRGIQPHADHAACLRMERTCGGVERNISARGIRNKKPHTRGHNR